MTQFTMKLILVVLFIDDKRGLELQLEWSNALTDFLWNM